MEDLSATLWPPIVGWLIASAGGCFALWRWIVGQRTQRAEFLERLIEKFKNMNYDEVLRRTEQSGKNDDADDAGIESVDEKRAYEFLIFLSYVCYLRQSRVIDNKAFQFFRCYIERALRIGAIRSAIEQIHEVNRIDISTSPYSALLGYGKKMKIRGVAALCAKIDMNSKSSQRRNLDCSVKTIKIGDGKTYRTHLDVLNGIFNKGLLQHASGGSPLSEGAIVWFPRIYKDKDAAGNRLWYNTLSSDGRELCEHCTDVQGRFGGNKDKPNVLRRYVFAKFMDDTSGEYRFIGVFDFKDKAQAPENEICWRYIRTADSFNTNSIK